MLESGGADGSGDADEEARSRLRGEVLITSAHQYAATGDRGAALAALDRALVEDPALEPAVWGARAAIALRGGDEAAALEAIDKVVAAADRADPRVLSAALLNRGFAHMGAGRLGPAGVDTEQAYRAAEAGNDAWGVHMAAHNLGYIRFLSGDLPGALSAMDAAARAVEDPPVGMPAMDRARVLLAAGLITEAAEFTALAAADFERNHANGELADALMVAAETDLLQADWGGALASARRAKALNRRRRNATAELLSELMEVKAATGLRRSSATPRRRARAEARHAAELAAALRATLPADATTASLLAAEALLDAGDPDAADAAAADGQVTTSTPIAIRVHARLVTARLQLARSAPTRGLASIRAGLDELADYQARFGSQDMQAGAAIHGARLARLGLRTAVSAGSPATVLQWLERSRAVSTRLPVVRPPADTELADALGRLRLAQIDARAAAVSGRPDPVLAQRIADLRRQVRTRSWTVSGSGTAQRPLTLRAVQRLLATDPDGPTVVAYLNSAAEQHVLVVDAKRAVHCRLGDRPEVERLIHRTAADLDLLATPRIPRAVRSVGGRSLQADLEALERELVAPILDRLQGGPVIVVAVGSTATLPWGLLPSLSGRPVSVSSSVTSAMAAVGRPGRAYLRGVLAVAGPDVPGGPEEVTAIAHLHAGAGLLTGDDATGEAVLGQLPQGGLLHIAAHGHHEPESPLFSSVQLADGPLFGYDIAPNPALPDHVVLSSCDVGRSADSPGGEPLGLAAALLRSGVSTVVAGVSRIADDVAAATMVVYHERLLAGDGPAVALAAAVASADRAPAPLTCFGAGA